MADLTTTVQDGEILELAYNVVNISPHVGRQQQVELLAPDGTTVIDSDAILLKAEDSERGVLRTSALAEGQDDGIYEVISKEGSRKVQVYVGIPDSVVTRTNDNNITTNASTKYGTRITTKVEWTQIGARLSANVSGATRAYVYRVSDGQLMGDTGISSLSAGDAFKIDLDISLEPHDGTNATRYNFVCDAEGSNYDIGYYDSATYPINSPDGNLSIIDGGRRETETESNALANLVEIGFVGF